MCAVPLKAGGSALGRASRCRSERCGHCCGWGGHPSSSPLTGRVCDTEFSETDFGHVRSCCTGPPGLDLRIAAIGMVVSQATETVALFGLGVALAAFSLIWRAVGSRFLARTGLERAAATQGFDAEPASAQQLAGTLEQRPADPNEVLAALTAQADQCADLPERLDSRVIEVKDELSTFDNRLGSLQKRVDDHQSK